MTPTQNNKSVKALFTHNVRKNTVLGVGSHANTALGFTLCCICHSTPPLILYFSYIIGNGALTYVYLFLGTKQKVVQKFVLAHYYSKVMHQAYIAHTKFNIYSYINLYTLTFIYCKSVKIHC